jgi:hypothetical protein
VSGDDEWTWTRDSIRYHAGAYDRGEPGPWRQAANIIAGRSRMEPAPRPEWAGEYGTAYEIGDERPQEHGRIHVGPPVAFAFDGLMPGETPSVSLTYTLDPVQVRDVTRAAVKYGWWRDVVRKGLTDRGMTLADFNEAHLWNERRLARQRRMARKRRRGW